jgi:murein L,D-transpeptidase YcbB/YkuD
MLVSAIETIQFNPAWHVPPGIARKEIFPKGRGYLARGGFTVRAGRLVQRPGPHNALGRVKFEFPNPFSVYLHDTPSRSAFASNHRSVSHGCVRLEKALDLARRLLPDWPPERMDRTLASQATTTVRLAHPVPVGLYYLTAFPDQDGSVSFRDDIYGWDEELLRLLDAQAPGRA